MNLQKIYSGIFHYNVKYFYMSLDIRKNGIYNFCTITFYVINKQTKRWYISLFVNFLAISMSLLRAMFLVWSHE